MLVLMKMTIKLLLLLTKEGWKSTSEATQQLAFSGLSIYSVWIYISFLLFLIDILKSLKVKEIILFDF